MTNGNLTRYEVGIVKTAEAYGVDPVVLLEIMEKRAMKWNPLDSIRRGARRFGKWMSARQRATLATRRWSHMANSRGRIAQEAVDKGMPNAAEAIAQHGNTVGLLGRFEDRFGGLVDYSGRRMHIEPIRTFPYQRFVNPRGV